MKSLIWLSALVVASSGFLFPGGGGGGGGCGGGCGCEDTSCIPKPPRLACQRICFSIPTLRFPSPCGGGCGCGKRKKREIAGDETCTVPEIKDVITTGLRNTPKESRDNIVAQLKEKFANTRYLVSCVSGKNDFKTSAEHFCSAGTEEQTCFVVQAVDQE